jgi:pimeloyl-ACP methyl ester carboxylesterase
MNQAPESTLEAAGVPTPVSELLARATRLETPCGTGAVVWHVWGPGNSTQAPLVLLHGGSGSWTHWLRNIDALVAAGRRVWVPDMPGFGDSAPPPDGSDVDALVAPLEAGLGHLLGARACELVGFSLGGLTAGLLALQHPARAARLVLIGAPGLGMQPVRPFVLKSWRQESDPVARKAIFRQNLAALMLYRDESIDELAVWLQAANVVRDRLLRRRKSRTPMLAAALPQLACPVHAIYGSEDVLYSGQLEAMAQVLATAADYRGLRLIEGAGHWVQYEAAPAFNEALAAALAH